jgi:succinate dehydrogenase / fumarate reductase, membrane anchor subunit
MASNRSDLSSRRIVVGAHYGTRDWLLQRVTAIVLAVYTVILLAALLWMPVFTYGTWSGLFATVWMKVATLLALFALIYHAWVGVRDIFMDYIKPTGVRLFLHAATVVALLGYALWAVIVLWRV